MFTVDESKVMEQTKTDRIDEGNKDYTTFSKFYTNKSSDHWRIIS